MEWNELKWNELKWITEKGGGVSYDTKQKDVRVVVVTWNVGNKQPKDDQRKELLGDLHLHIDIHMNRTFAFSQGRT